MFFYFFYLLINPFAFILIHIIKFFNKKLYLHIKNESHSFNYAIDIISKVDRNKKKILLFHAASSGEFEQLKPILKKIDKKSFFIVQSFSSPTIYNKEHDNQLFDVSCYHPYDFFWKSYIFFKRIAPSAYIITRHDIWPLHLFIANKLKIKIFYINANIHKNSIWKRWYMQNISKKIFKNIFACYVPSKNILKQAQHIIPNNKIMITGDTRFDQIKDRFLENKSIHYLPAYFLKKQNVIFGSYDLYDEKLILNALKKYYYDGEKSLQEVNHGIILVPHEPDSSTVDRMILKLKKHNFSVQKFSNISKNKNVYNILIIDQVGILADLYQYCDLAYVGAGFGRGVHSVIEPAIHNCIISFGPNIEILDEAKYMVKNNLAYIIHDVKDMLNFLNLNLNHKKQLKMKTNLKNYMQQNLNASEMILNNITNTL